MRGLVVALGIKINQEILICWVCCLMRCITLPHNLQNTCWNLIEHFRGRQSAYSYSNCFAQLEAEQAEKLTLHGSVVDEGGKAHPSTPASSRHAPVTMPCAITNLWAPATSTRGASGGTWAGPTAAAAAARGSASRRLRPSGCPRFLDSTGESGANEGMVRRHFGVGND